MGYKVTMLDNSALLPESYGQVTPHFQPIVSLRAHRVVGLEALSRFLTDGGVVSPGEIFARAVADGLTLQLDRSCRRAAVSAFAASNAVGESLLFLNLASGILNNDTVGSNHIADLVASAGLSPQRVAIEVVESEVSSPGALREFSSRYHDKGFLIVLDDFGARHSNLERLAEARPDVIKIDRRLIDRVDEDPYKRTLLGVIAELATSLGALSLAEGVERIEELAVCAEIGIDLYQGFLFARPGKDTGVAIDAARHAMATADAAVRTALAARVSADSQRALRTERLAGLIAASAGQVRPDSLDAFLRGIVDSNQEIECAFLLDQEGRQITDTACKTSCPGPDAHPIFRPAPKGVDHSLKDYFFHVKNLRVPYYLTRPYISLATGNLCRTMALCTRDLSGRDMILCVDLVDHAFRELEGC